MLVAPDKKIEEVYEVVLEAEEAVIKALQAGTPLSEVFDAGLAVVKKKKPEFVGKLTKSFGFVLFNWCVQTKKALQRLLFISIFLLL